MLSEVKCHNLNAAFFVTADLEINQVDDTTRKRERP